MGPSLIGRLETLHQMAVWRSALSPARNPRKLKGMETRLHPDGMEQVWRTVPSLRGTDMKWMAPSRFGDGCAASIPEGTEGMFHPRGMDRHSVPPGMEREWTPAGMERRRSGNGHGWKAGRRARSFRARRGCALHPAWRFRHDAAGDTDSCNAACALPSGRPQIWPDLAGG